MAVMMGKLYAALREANVPEDKATAAAEEVAGFDNRLAELKGDMVGLKGEVSLVKWMIGFNLAMTAALVGNAFLAGR